MSHLTTHILDTAAGKPAAGVAVQLEAHEEGGWTAIASGTTNQDGRVSDLGPDRLETGSYRLRFEVDAYLREHHREPSFFPEVIVTFRVDAIEEHYHVPLLLNPFGYSTYRGS